MTFIDLLNQAGDAPEGVHIKFLHNYKPKEKTLHFFFEGGDDQSFYVNFIENIFPEDYTFHYYICNGKENVLANYEDIDWAVYNKSRILFFTDKDLDDILGVNQINDQNIFETQYYSIENYLVTAEVYVRFLREICLITDGDIISELKGRFIEELRIFSEEMTRISAWVVYCRKNNFDVNLSDIDIAKLFKITKDFNIKRAIPKGAKNRFDYICSVTKTNYYSLPELKEISKNLYRIETPKKFIRGKYELWFLYAFCKNTIEVTVPQLNKKIKDHNRKSDKKIMKCKVTIQIKPENILQVTAPRVKLSKDISDFLQLNLMKLSD